MIYDVTRCTQHFDIYWKIVCIFKIIEQNHLKLCLWIQTIKRNDIVQVLIGYNSNSIVSRPLRLVF